MQSARKIIASFTLLLATAFIITTLYSSWLQHDFAAGGSLLLTLALAVLSYDRPFFMHTLFAFTLSFVLIDPFISIFTFNSSPLLIGLGMGGACAYLRGVKDSGDLGSFWSGSLTILWLFAAAALLMSGLDLTHLTDGSVLTIFRAMSGQDESPSIMLVRGLKWWCSASTICFAQLGAWLLASRYIALPKEERENVSKIFFAILCFYAIYALHRYLIKIDTSQNYWGYNRLTSPRSNPNAVGFILGAITITCTYLTLALKTPPWRAHKALYGIVLLSAALLALTLSRTGALATFSALGLLAFYRSYGRRRFWLLAAILGAFCFSLLACSLFYQKNYASRYYVYLTTEQEAKYHPEYSRFEMYAWALKSLPDYFMTGYGSSWQEQYADYYAKIREKGIEPARIVHIHNMFLELLLRGGLILLLPFVAALVSMLFSSPTKRWGLPPVPLSMLAYLVIQCSFNANLLYPNPLLVFSLLAAVLPLLQGPRQS